MKEKAFDVAGALDAAKQLKETRGNLLTRRAALVEEQKGLAEQDAALYRAPLLTSEVKEMAHRAIDNYAAEFLESWRNALQDFATLPGRRPPMSGPVNFHFTDFVRSEAPANLQDAEAFARGEQTRLTRVDNSAPHMPSQTFWGLTKDEMPMDAGRNIVHGVLPEFQHGSTWHFAWLAKQACFFMGDQIKAKIDAHFMSAVPARLLVTDAMPIAERRAILAANDERRKELQTEINAIDAQVKQITAGLQD